APDRPPVRQAVELGREGPRPPPLLACRDQPPISTSSTPGRVNTQSARATVRCANATVAGLPERSARVFQSAVTMMFPTNSTTPRRWRNLSVVYIRLRGGRGPGVKRLEHEDVEPRRRPVDHHGFADDVAHGDKPERPAVLAVAAVVAQDEDIGRRDHRGAVIPLRVHAQVGLAERLT